MSSRLADVRVSEQWNWLYGLCLRLERNRHDADDLFQDTWLKVQRCIDSYDQSKPLRPWLARICVNTYRDGFRRAARRIAHSKRTDGVKDEGCAPETASEWPGPEAQAVDRAFRQALAGCLYALEDKYRLPVILQYYHGIGYDEIARTLGLKQGTVKSRLNEAKKKLRRQLEVLGYESVD